MNFKLPIAAGILLSIVVVSNLSSCYYDNESYLYQISSCNDTTYTYTGRVKTIMDQYCATAGCHAGPSPEDGLGLETYDQVKAGVENGNVICSMKWTSGCSQMPKNAAKLDECIITAVEKWKEKGYPN